MSPDNLASQRAAARCGFTGEGVLRSQIPFRGTRRDTVVFSLLRPRAAIDQRAILGGVGYRRDRPRTAIGVPALGPARLSGSATAIRVATWLIYDTRL